MSTKASGPVVRVHGLEVNGLGHCLERVRKKSTEISLLARGGGPEVMLQTIAPGSRVTVPAGGPRNGFEFYFVLDGFLDVDLGDGRYHKVRKGEYLTAARLEQDVYLKTDSGVTLLYVSSQPVFHELSEEINQLLALAKAVEEKDPLIRNHCERMQQLTTAVGDELRLPPARLELLIYAAFLHDVGKADLPDDLLALTGPLSESDWEQVHRHPTAGRQRLEATYLRDAGIIVEQHHEWFDGRGYPSGLKGNETLIEAQIIAVVDAYDAMTSDRPYRARMSQEEALAELERCAGTQFNPTVVEALKKVLASSGDRAVPW
ncbi:MAG: HD domain-containing protein [Bacillota bacterium]|jgi:HD-GYP domain-containing protein (c-di-GMP phosphodiesterase class II)|nr:MAG: HD domain-containing protein [Bacillota bacterium]